MMGMGFGTYAACHRVRFRACHGVRLVVYYPPKGLTLTLTLSLCLTLIGPAIVSAQSYSTPPREGPTMQPRLGWGGVRVRVRVGAQVRVRVRGGGTV